MLEPITVYLLLALVYFPTYISCVKSFKQEVSVFSKSPNIVFHQTSNKLTQSELVELYAAVLGYPMKRSINWDGMYILSPFDAPQSIVTISVPNLEVDLAQEDFLYQYPLTGYFDSRATFHNLIKRISGGTTTSDEVVVLDEMVDENEISNVQTDSFIDNLSAQVIRLRRISQQIGNSLSFNKTMWLHFNIPDALSVYGYNSENILNATVAVSNEVENFCHSLINIYKNKVFCNVVAYKQTLPDLVRIRRDSNVNENSKVKEDINLSKKSNENFPVIFNMILWFTITMGLSLLAICLFIGSMDPGRDSIIYRMTSTRTKKDN